MTTAISRPVTLTVLPGPQEVGAQAAALIAAAVAHATTQGGHCLIGCPTGRSPAPVYQALAGLTTRLDLDLRALILVLMDDYVVPGPDGAPRRIDPVTHCSCVGYAERFIRTPLNQAAAPHHALPAGQVWAPDPADPPAYDQRIAAAGGIDLFLLATGTSDGHVAFNPPGAPSDSRTRIVPLSETTRRDNLATFPGFASLADVPQYGISVGIATIREARHAVMVAEGAEKAAAVARIAAASGYDPDWPATILAECAQPALIVDQAAAQLIA
ncbi:MAG: 6-phosphogluconolactonase [Bifidobacteriaceae bacterium]|jgi:glucosamine-6-phosphate deaminase|nr:6-phosphogluconolactonase [Bifidobacteriaceae bacterium]